METFHFYTFAIRARLTEKGLQNVPGVLKVILAYLDHYKSQGNAAI